jgi:uncharacterized membrane protein
MINIFGWLGVAGVLLAYILLSFGVIGSRDFIYQLLNGVGAILLIIESAWRKDYPFTFLNVVWSLVALVTIIQLLVF